MWDSWFEPPWNPPDERNFPVELKQALTAPCTLLDEGIDGGLVCACMHSMVQTT